MARFYAVQNPTFQRALRLISAITKANPAVVTTSFAHDYETGDIVRISVPKGYGMSEANNFVGKITVTSTTQFEVDDLNSTNFTTFSIPGSINWSIGRYPSAIPVGEISANLGGATQNTLPH